MGLIIPCNGVGRPEGLRQMYSRSHKYYPCHPRGPKYFKILLSEKWKTKVIAIGAEFEMKQSCFVYLSSITPSVAGKSDERWAGYNNISF
jgi:hypothetical protein